MPTSAPGAEPRPRKERTKNADLRRGQLLDAVLRSIVRNGLHGTTLATVAREAGLSQGVAVFYFETKEALLAAALERHYLRYEANWRGALETAGDGAAERLAALVRAEFHPEVCSPEAQIVWHAFWGQANARPLFNEIAHRFDSARATTLTETTAALLEDLGRDRSDAVALASGIEGLTDGLWLQMYLGNSPTDAKAALAISSRFLAALFPERAKTFQRLLTGEE